MPSVSTHSPTQYCLSVLMVLQLPMLQGPFIQSLIIISTHIILTLFLLLTHSTHSTLLSITSIILFFTPLLFQQKLLLEPASLYALFSTSSFSTLTSQPLSRQSKLPDWSSC